MRVTPSPTGQTSTPIELPDIADTGSLLADCRAYLTITRELIAESFHPSGPIWPLLEARSEAVDRVLCHLWNHFLGRAEGMSLVAVGGYGRGELYPCSDIDILFLLNTRPDEAAESALSAMLQALWDLGLKIGQSVRTIEECAELAKSDLTVLTTLLETRPLAGDPTLLPELQNAISSDRMWDSKAFFVAKLEETQERHDRLANTEHSLEPHVKNGPGGLRDIQVIGWVAARHFGVALESLSEDAFLTADEKEMLQQGHNFIGQVRFGLHMVAGREEDRLLFDHQRKLAVLWEMVDGDKLAVEQFMQVFYRWTDALSQLSRLLMQIFDQHILHADELAETLPIDEDFVHCGGLLRGRGPDVFSARPSNLLRASVILANNPELSGMDAETWRAMRAAVDLIDDDFRAAPENRQLFMKLIHSPHGVTKQLRRMARNGVLGRYLPEFGAVEGQMQFDLFHAYTVDAHTLAVVANTRRFMRADFTEKFPVSTRIAQRLRKPELLFLAALYHDIGKGRGGDHSELGAVDAKAFCERHFLDARDTELVVWLVRNHLVMSSISQRKDISDPQEVLRFASHVATEERLDYLYTLTVADIHGTNPDLWNAWRGSLLRQLYTETRRALRRGLENPLARKDVVDATRLAAAELLEYRGFFDDELDSLWATRGDDYFLRERPEDIAWHTEAIADHKENQGPLVLVRPASDSPVANATQIFVHATDEPDLFARICAELESLELSIFDARIYSGTDGATLDTFFVLGADGNPLPTDEGFFEDIRGRLQRALEIEKRRSISRRTPRQLKSFFMPTETSVYQDAERGWTVLEIATPDRPGLLARIGELFVDHEVALQGAKIQTLGERVEDVFFLTEAEGGPVVDSQRLDALQDAICEVLDAGARESR